MVRRATLAFRPHAPPCSVVPSQSVIGRVKLFAQQKLRLDSPERLAYLRVLKAQQSVAEANLEQVGSIGEMWQAASEVAGLMLEDQWPLFHERK